MLGLFQMMMPDVNAFDQKEHIFCNVRGVVGHTLQIMSDKDQIESRPRRSNALLHKVQQFQVNRIFQLIHLVIGQKNALRKRGIPPDESVQTFPHHQLNSFRHVGNVHERPEGRTAEQRDGALSQINREIPHTLKVAVDFDRRGEKAKVFGDRLVEGQEAGGHFVILDIQLIDAGFCHPNALHQTLIPFDQRTDAVVNRGFHKTSHFENLVLEVAEF
ncbi:MAG: hypothetical protein QOJ99_5342 [Bryobacterales bacterium]|nr:hypothetical protein [Bryobacterales bacterium]